MPVTASSFNRGEGASPGIALPGARRPGPALVTTPAPCHRGGALRGGGTGALKHAPRTWWTPQPAGSHTVPARPLPRIFMSHRRPFVCLLFLIPKERRLFSAGGPRGHRRASRAAAHMHPRAPRAHVGVRAYVGVRAHVRAPAPRRSRRSRTPPSRPDRRRQHFECVTNCTLGFVLFPTEDPPKGKRSARPPHPKSFEKWRTVRVRTGSSDKSGDAGQHRGTSVPRTQWRGGSTSQAARASSPPAAPAAWPGAGSEASRTRAWLAGGSRRGRGPRIPAPPAGAAAGAAGRWPGSCEPRKTSGGIFCHRRPEGQERGR